MSLLVISGHDPSSFAGVAIDIETALHHDVLPKTIISCLTVQNETEFLESIPVSYEIISKQFEIITRDNDIPVIKIGMVSDYDSAQAIRDSIKKYRERQRELIVILDPIIKSSRGGYVSGDQIKIIRTLLEVSDIMTPNIPELEHISGIVIKDRSYIEAAIKTIEDDFSIIVKTGHLPSDNNKIATYLHTKRSDMINIIYSDRIELTNISTRGTGCRFATSLACSIHQKLSLVEAIQSASDYMTNFMLDLRNNRLKPIS